MNKIYKVIWNAATGTFVVVSELSKSKTKTKSKQLNTVKTTLFTVSALASAVLGAGQAIAAVAVGSNDSNNFAITTGAVASGTNSVAVGENSNSSGNEATAVGTSANASGYQSTALGMLSNATMNQATAIGAKSNATGIQSTALGVSANATGNQAIALGSNASASNSQSMALGVNANATGDQSTAIGSNAVVNSVKGIAIGYNANATGGQTANIAIGENTTAGASGAVVLGINASADSDSYSAISIGTNATTQFKDAVAIGTNTIAKEASSIAIGSNTKANDKSQAVAIGYTANSSGYQAVALGSNASTATNAGSSLAFGTNATTRAANSIAIGRDAETGLSSGTVTDGAHAVAIGINAKAQKINSIAIGNGSTVTNENATAIGVSSVASGIQATALGALSNAEADQSVAIGRGAKTNSTVAADGARSGGGIAIGRDANASGAGANAMGINAVAVSHGIAIGTNANVAGASSISIGTGSNSSGINSVSVGARAKSLGDNTVAVGQASNASGKSAVAVGDGANSSNNQTVAVGTSSKASAQGATAFGDSTNASGINSLALGIASKASQENTVSIGASADASKANAIALGAASTTLTDATKETQAIIGGITYDGFATRATVATGDQVSVGAAGSERQIKHVAAGNISETSTDAINGSQLYIIAKGLQEKLTHFYSVNNINSASGNYNNDGATGVDALAAGVGTVAAGEEASAVGKSANASGNFSVAFGNTAKALNRNSVAIGSNANSSNDYAIAIGLDTVSSGNGGVAIGSGSSSTQDKAVALGNDAKAQQANATAIGANAKALNTNATALGALANASGISAIAVGENANANSTHSIAIGRTATVNERQDGIAIGTNVVSGLVANDSVYSVAGASRTGDGTDRLKSSVAIGYNAKALGDESVSLGINTHAVGNSAVAIGESAKALSLDNIAIGNDALTGLGTNETAIGSYSRAAGGYSTAIGTRAAATGIQSVAVGGTSAYAKGQQAAALNAYAYAGAKASNALGYHTVVTNNAHSSTALGTASVVSGAYSGVWNASIHKNAAQYVDTDRSFVGGNASYAIGNQNIIGNTSSDTFILGNNVKLGASAATLNTANITGTQNNISTRDHTGVVYSGVTNVTGAVALGSNTGVSVAKGVALGYDSKATTDKGVAGYDPLTQASSSDTSATWKSTSGAVAVGDVASSITRQITGVAAGTADTDAVNVAQLKAISSSAPQGMNVGADQGVVNKDTNLVQHQFSKALSILAGNATFDETSSTNLLTTVLQSEAGNTDIVIRMKDIPTFKGITLTNGSNTTSLTTTTDGLDVGGDKVTNIANGTADSDAVNLAQLNATNANVTNVTNNVTTLQTEVAKGWNITTAQTGTGNVSGKLDDQINMGETVTIEAGNNINITQSANKVSIATSMDPNFTTVTATNKIAIGTNGPSLSTTGIDAANQKITNVSSAVNDGDAVNYGQLNSTLAASKWTLKTSQDNAGEAQVGEINPNDSVTIDGTGLVKVTHTTEASNVNKIHIGIETQAVSSEDGIAKLNGNSAVNGTTTGTQNGNALVSANDLINAVNSASWTLKEKGTEKDQVKAGDVVDFIDGTGTRVTVTTTNNNVSTVKFDVNISDISSSVAFSTATNTTTATDSNKLATAGDVANVANNISTYLIDKGFALVGNKGGAVSKKLGEQVTVKGTLADATDASAENIRVDNDNGELVIKLAEAPTFKSINLKDATNGTTLTTTAEGLNVGGDKITNVANGTQDSDAVNLAQLNATNTNVTNVTNNVTTLQTDMAAAKNNITTLQTDVAKGWNITTAQTGTGNVSGKLDDQINMGETVTIEAGNNINITQSAGKVSIATSMDPNFTTVTATNKIAIGTNGPSLSTAGIDAANTVISNVTNATVNATSKDAVNGSQLYALANSTAAALGGGSSVNSDGTVTAPSFSITDPTSNTVTNYNNVGGALTALNTAINQPLTFAGNNGSTTQKLGSTLNISGSLASGGSSKNIRTNVTAGKVEILLSENPEFNSLNLTSNGNSVTFTPTAEGVQVAKTDGSAAKISNVANGTADSDAVNLSQLNAKVANSAWKLEGNGSEVATVRAGDAVNIVSGAGTTAVVNMNGSKPTITFNVNNTSLATDSAGKVTAPTGDEADKFVKAGDLATILNTVAWNVTAADGDGELDGVATEEQITAGDKVTYTAGKNIKVKQNGAEFTLSTTDNVSFDTVNATKIVIGNPNGDNTVLSSTVTGLDVGGDKITNIANGTADSDAVNLAQLNATNANVTNVTNNVTTLQTEVAKGWNITTAQTGTGNVSGTLNDQINMGETVTIEAGNNINITQSAGKVSIATSMDPNFTTVTATDKIAIGTNGPSLSTAGIDAANTVISNVTNATVNATSKDAVNGSQLYALANSTAAALGGGSSVNSDGTVTAPSFSITDPTSNTVTNYNNVGGALTALNTAINQPLTFAGNDGSTTQKLGSTLNISGSLASGGSSKNIRTNVTAGKVEILLSENPEFNSLNLTSNGNSVTFTPTAEGVQVAKADGSAAKISNVADGTDANDAVNVSQLNSKVANAKWALKTSQDGATAELVGNVNADDEVVIDGKDVVKVSHTTETNGVSKVHVAVETQAVTFADGIAKTNGNSQTGGTENSAANRDALVRAGDVIDTVNNATASLINKGMTFVGNDATATIHKNLGETLTIKGGLADSAAASDKNLRVDVNSGNLVVKMAENPEFATMKLSDGTNSVTFTPTADGVTVAKADGSAAKIGNVADGNVSANSKDAVNGSQLFNTASSTANLLGGTTTVNSTTGIPEGFTFSTKKADNSEVNTTPVTNVTAALTELNSYVNSGFNVQERGITKGTVTPTENVNFVDGKYTVANVTTEANGVTNITFDIKGTELIADNSPIVYTDAQGNKVYKQADGSFNTQPDGSGNRVEAADVIASVQNPDGTTTNNTTLANVKSNFTPDTDNTLTKAADNPTGSTYSNAATVLDVLNSGWNLQGNGMAIDFVKHNDTVNFINGQGTTITVARAANGVNTVKVDSPLAYVNTDTTDLSTPSNTVKFVGATNSQDPVNVQNVASGLGGQSIDDAANNSVNKNNAVNVTDLKTAVDTALDKGGFNLATATVADSSGESIVLTTLTDADKRIKTNETFNLNAGDNIKITQTQNGFEVATTDKLNVSEISVGEKDNPAVKITAENGVGTIGLSGKDGANTISTDIALTKGAETVDSKDADGINRITYTTPNADGTTTTREVATMDDGLVFAGDSGENVSRKLGETLSIKGGVTDPNQLTDNNIGVATDPTNGGLTIKLAKDVDLGDDGSVTTGNTTVDNAGITISNATDPSKNVSLTQDGLNNGGNQITNVAAAATTYDGAVDAYGNPLTKVGDKYYTAEQLAENGQPKAGATESTPVGTSQAYSGLADLNGANSSTVATVADLKNIGWVVSTSENQYEDDVRHTNKVDFKGEGLVSVSGETNATTGVREITVSLKTGEVVPTDGYVDKDGNKLIKTDDGKYYKASDTINGTPKSGAEEIAEADVLKPSAGEGLVTGNQVGDAIQKSGWTVGKGTTDGVDFNNADERINPDDSIRFADGKNTVAKLGTKESVDESGKQVTTTTVTFDVDLPIDYKYTDANGNTLVKVDGNYYNVDDIDDTTGKPKATATAVDSNSVTIGAQLVNNNQPAYTAGQQSEGAEEPTAGSGGVSLNNVAWATNADQAVNKDQLDQTVATSGWELQNNGEKRDKVQPNDKVNFIDGGNSKAVVSTAADGKSSTVQINLAGLPVTYSTTMTDVNGNEVQIPVTKVGDKFYTVGADGNPTATEVDPTTLASSLVNPTAAPNEIGAASRLSNVAEGDISPTSKQAVNGSQLYSLGGLVGGDNIVVNATTGVQELKPNTFGGLTAANGGMTRTDGTAFTAPTNVVDAVNTLNSEGTKYFKANSTGEAAKAIGQGSIAMGSNAVANGAGSIALGQHAVVESGAPAGSVAIGEGAVAGQANQGSYAINDAAVAGKTGPETKVFSVGKVGDERQIQHVAPGVISASSTDAVNGSQLYATNREINKGWNIQAEQAEGTNGVVEGGSLANVKMGDTVKVKAGQNIHMKQSGAALEVATIDTPTFTSVQVGGSAGPLIGATEDGDVRVSMSDGKTAARITNVAPGRAATDAANVGQLQEGLDQVHNRVSQLDKRVRGIGANSAAASSLPQAYLPGKSMVAAAGGTYSGASAIAIGYSRTSDNGKLILKATGTANSAGHYSGGVGVGYQW